MKLRDYSTVFRWLLFTLVFVAIGAAFVQQCIAGEKTKSPLKTILIDDFSKEGSKKNFRTDWEFVSDRVMGGISSGKIVFINEDKHSSTHCSTNSITNSIQSP